MKRILLIGAMVLVLLASGGVAAFWRFPSSHSMRLPGIVEVQEVRLGSKIGGRVNAVLIEEGAIVSAGDRLVEFDAPELKNQRLQLQAKLAAAEAEWLRVVAGARQEEKDAAIATAAAAKARWERVKFGWRKEEKDQAESEFDAANADFNQASKDYERVSKLFRMKSISPNEYETALAYRDRAKGRAEAAKSKLEMLRKGSRPEDKNEAKAEFERAEAKAAELLHGSRWEDIQLARARVDEIEAKIAEVDINLKEASVVVPANLGRVVVEVVAVRPGDIVPPNQSVVRVLHADDLWVKVFVPETKYGQVTLNKKVKVTIDSHPGVVLDGEVIQRSNVSEFTPRNVQSVDERRLQVFGVKIRVTDRKGVLNAGMAAEVTVPLD